MQIKKSLFTLQLYRDMTGHYQNDFTSGFILSVQEIFLLVQISFLRNKLVQYLEACGAPPAQPTHGFHPGLTDDVLSLVLPDFRQVVIHLFHLG